MGTITHFEITADDMDRASAFYRDAFGWTLTATSLVDGYLLASTGPGAGIDGALMKREFRAQPSIVWVSVERLEPALERVREAGGTVGRTDEVPGIGRTAYIVDSEGNTVGVIEPLPRA